MKKILFCLTLCLAMLLLVACNGDKQEPDTTVGETTPITNPDTDGEATSAETEAEETTAEAEETTEPETEYVPAFDPTVFEPTAIPSGNVAREGFFMASNCKSDGGYSNIYANDGDKTTGFSTKWNQTSNIAHEFYGFIDLTRAFAVESIKLYPLAGEEAGFPKAFEVQISMDGQAYTTAATVTDAVASAEGFEVKLNGDEARFVKIVTKELNPATEGRGCYLAFGELEVYAPVDTSTNTILNRHDVWLYVNPNIPMQLTVLHNRDGSAVGSDWKYMTTNPEVALVNDSGLVTPRSVGTAEIYVTDGINQSVCLVEVKDQAEAKFHIETFFNPKLMPDQIGTALDVLKSEGITYVGNTHVLDPAGNDHAPYTLFLCNERGMAYQVAEEGISGSPAASSLTGEMLIRTIQKYEHKAGFYGLCLRDEPTDDYLDYAKLVREVNNYNPHIEVYLNQFPMVSVPGDSDSYYADVASISGGNGRLHYISFDSYPHAGDGTFNPEFYRDMNAMRKAGLLYNCSTAYYLQAWWRWLLSPTEQMYNAVLGVSYGYKKFQYFSAFTGSDRYGLIQSSLIMTEMGVNVTAANEFIRKFEGYVGNCDAIEVYHTDETLGQDLLPADFVFTHMGGGEAIYSLFEALDGSGKQYILITNKNYAADGAVTFIVKAADGLRDLKILDTETEEMVPLTVAADGTFTVAIGAGECALIELPDGFDASRPDPDTDNLAINRPAYVSSNASNFWSQTVFSSMYLTDGNTDENGWSPASDDEAPRIKLDLGEVYDISRVKIYMTSDIWNRRCKNFTISVSEDGVNYVEVSRAEAYEWDKTTKSGEFAFDTVAARYVLIQSTSSTGGGAFGEIEVYR
ncbi:MAG: hypothetical protein E7610_06565 [Ruminococcaceae bacterium]|nr:hypothetical protein [Oscillospiraceae bacterium]